MNNLTQNQLQVRTNKVKQTSENYKRYIEAPRLYATLLFFITLGILIIASYMPVESNPFAYKPAPGQYLFRLIWVGLIAYTSVFVIPRLRYGKDASEEDGQFNRRFLLMPTAMVTFFILREVVFWGTYLEHNNIYKFVDKVDFALVFLLPLSMFVILPMLLIVPPLYLAKHGERKWGKTGKTPPTTAIRAVEFKIVLAIYLFILLDVSVVYAMEYITF